MVHTDAASAEGSKTNLYEAVVQLVHSVLFSLEHVHLNLDKSLCLSVISALTWLKSETHSIISDLFLCLRVLIGSIKVLDVRL